jgi:hypothetical protein
MSDEYRGVPIADILKAAGLNPDLTTNMGDPRNVAYIGPLEDPDDEHMAEEMAAVSYSAWREQHDDDEMGYEQCLVDARRMLCDGNYTRLFHGR